MHEDVKLLLPAVAFGSATDEETAQVYEHIEQCALCEEQLVEFMETVGMMGAMSAPRPVSPPPALKERVMSEVTGHRPARAQPSWTWARLRPLAAMATAAAAVIALVLTLQLSFDPENPASPRSSVRELVVQPSPGAKSMRGVDMSMEGKMVRVSDLPQAPSGRVWQLWAIDGKGSARSIAVLDSTDSARVPASATTLAITQEPAGGSSQPTMQPMVTVKI